MDDFAVLVFLLLIGGLALILIPKNASGPNAATANAAKKIVAGIYGYGSSDADNPGADDDSLDNYDPTTGGGTEDIAKDVEGV